MRALLCLALLQFPTPGEHDPYVRPAGDTNSKYFEWLENNTQIVYPLLALVVLTLVVVGILQAWRAPALDIRVKTEAKREIMLQLRREVTGSSVDVLAKRIGLEPLKVVKLLEEMEADGMVESHTNTQRLTYWRVRGLRSEK